MNVSGHTEAAREVDRLRGAAVVLTTYDVLQREVHFSPNKERLASLRSEKRYVVPESPLLTLRCMLWLCPSAELPAEPGIKREQHCICLDARQ